MFLLLEYGLELLLRMIVIAVVMIQLQLQLEMLIYCPGQALIATYVTMIEVFLWAMIKWLILICNLGIEKAISRMMRLGIYIAALIFERTENSRTWIHKQVVWMQATAIFTSITMLSTTIKLIELRARTAIQFLVTEIPDQVQLIAGILFLAQV